MISDVLKKKFDEVIARYPLKRSAMVPLLLFAQDEIGFVSDEVIDEVARRLEVPRIEVVEVISYYSMLHRQPIGRYNLQVCTNVSCMLRGAERVYEHCSRRLGISHRQTTPDKVFSLEEVEPSRRRKRSMHCSTGSGVGAQDSQLKTARLQECLNIKTR